MESIDQIRAFNRAMLRRVGAAEAAFRDEGVSLAAARALLEIDRLGPVPARRLADALGLNEGYLSRLVRGLVRQGLVARRMDRSDRRARVLRLTDAGQTKADRLTAVSRQRVAAWFDAAGPAAAAEVAARLREVDAYLTAAEAEPVALTPLQTGDIGWLIQAHGEAYAASDGFDASFEVCVARIVAEFREGHDPAIERAWIARQGTRRLGSVFCVKGPEPGMAQLRLFYLVRAARGQGLGRRMLETCLGFAKAAGYDRMTLRTHESHAAACALYAAQGFALVSSTPKRSFGRDCVEQVFARAL